MWFGIILAAISLFTLRYFSNSIRALILTRNVVGPPSIPILGSALYFFNKTSEGTVYNFVTNARETVPFKKFQNKVMKKNSFASKCYYFRDFRNWT